MDYLVVKWLHVISATVLFGAGVGSAFHVFAATLRRTVPGIAMATRNVVLADWLFTLPSAIFQVASGLWLADRMDLALTTPWVAASLVLYAVAIACWIPVIWIQIQLRDESQAALRAGPAEPLAPRYWRLFFWWTALGFGGLFSFIAIFWLMVAKQVPFA
jgi:uncharacterized membrane protein